MWQLGNYSVGHDFGWCADITMGRNKGTSLGGAQESTNG